VIDNLSGPKQIGENKVALGSYADYKSEAARLWEISSKSENIDPAEARELAVRVVETDNGFISWIGSQIDYGGSETANRKLEVVVPLQKAMVGLVDRAGGIDKINMTPQQTAYYLQAVEDEMFVIDGVQAAGPYRISFDQEQRFYYVRPFAFDFSEPGRGQEIVGRVADNREAVLTDEELAAMMEYQRGVWKVHVNVPVEKRMEVFRGVMSRCADRIKLAVGLRNQGVEVTKEMLRDKGAKFVDIGTWKFDGFDAGQEEMKREIANSVPDFIFYVSKKEPLESRQAAARRLAADLSEVVRGREVTGEGGVPRFSQLIEGGDGYVHSSLSVAQGDSNVKLWLKDNGLLDRFFDPETNYALMRSAGGF